MNAITPAAAMRSLFGGRSQNGGALIPTIPRDVLGLTTEDLTSIVTNALSEQYLLPPSRPRSPRKQPHFFAVLRNKFNAGFLQCVTNPFHSLLGNLPALFFEIHDSRQAQRSSFCKLRLGHV
jgi:hypothetical protein